ncbi:MAG: hybrid sensor histidine kinase/response regulator [Desulfobacteraceae bacterium]|jgi:chemosensory pili system protein ChpA (sensor histidine kinase/response regulator)
MFELSSYEIKKDVIKEVKEYLPILKKLITKIKADDTEESYVRKFYELIETIRGASSLVKLNGISRVASELLKVMENIIEHQMAITPEVFDAISVALTFFDEFSLSEDENTSDDISNVTNTISTLKGASSQEVETDCLDPILDLSNLAEDDELDFDAIDDVASLSGGNDTEKSDHQIEDDGHFYNCELGNQRTSLLPLTEKDTPEVNEISSIITEDESVVTEDESEDVSWPQDELLEGFYQEAEDHFQNLGNALAQLETQISGPTDLTTDHKELLRLIRRAVHTIKGAAAVIRLGDIAAWGHDFEDLLDWLYEKAQHIEPNTIRVVADSADLLEKLVSTPEDVDSAKQQELRNEFKNIIGTKTSEFIELTDSKQDDLLSNSSEYLIFNDSEDSDLISKEPVFPVSFSKTLRVEMGKIESLVNLASELIIALSGFDENMNNFNSIINELDRSRLRLKGTARDLESGYELKAIRDLNVYQYQLKTGRKFVDSEFMDFDLLELDRYSEFNLLIRSLNETSVDVSTISNQLSNVHRGFKSYFNRLRMLLSELQEKVMRVRMTPMSSIVNRLRSTVRETAASLNKKVRLVISGEEIELDKRVWETLADPLMHLLRNAIDHGVEPMDIRKSGNKPELATINLTAAYQGNQVILRVIDDGAGLDFDTIRQRAKELDLEVDGKSDSELTEVIFSQGFSTRQEVTKISGRGVGLDVVQENISALKGNVMIDKTEPGVGTSVLIRIPLTLAVMRALIFEVNGRLYATALYDIREMLRIHPRDLQSHQGISVQIGDHVFPFYNLSEILPKNRSNVLKRDNSERILVLVIDTGTWQGAVAIDKMHTQKEIVVKSLGTYLQHVQGIAGATIMGDGKVIPILNIEELLHIGQVKFPQIYQQRQEVHNAQLEILVVDDSVSVRMVISQLIQRQGWEVQTAKDGVEAIELLHEYTPDLIILDIEMPRMNGYEFMRAFRSQEKFVDIPVIMLTSRSAHKHRDKAEKSGINAFLIKPYEDATFISMIKKLVRLNG